MAVSMLKNPDGRSTPEWIGKDNDSVPPPRVIRRVLLRYDRKCHRTKKPIRGEYGVTWQIDHKDALCNGGQNRESNLAPILIDPHKEKTAEDRKTKSKIDNTIDSQFGIKPKSHRPVPGSKNTPWASKYDRDTGRFKTVRRQ